MSSGAMTTRGQKRRRGARDLWDVIVNNDDISFKYIIPRLNSTDVKILYGVHTETRKLIKRSSRAEDLKEKFKIEEMSSISTLEVAWENRENKSLWPRDWDGELSFSFEVAHTNKLELLKWIREEKKCKWDEWTIAAAAFEGNLEMVKYCVANKCPINEDACAFAAENGHLECLKYLHEEVKAPWGSAMAESAAPNGHLHILEYLVERKYDQYSEWACMLAAMRGHLDCLKYLHETAKAPWDWETATSAAKTGHLHILQYLVERKYDEYDAQACQFAADNGHLDCLKYLHETAKAPWDEDAVRIAHGNNQIDCLQYLLDNNCPLPYGWRYEDGVLGVRNLLFY
ncbi:unnamed protein product [Bathycoccus prasinos]|jgi:predicted metal-binding protein